MFESTENCVCDQATAIGNDVWLSELKNHVEGESQGQICRQQDVTVDAETVKTDSGTVEEEINDVEDSIGDTESDLSEENEVIVEQLKKIMVEGRKNDAIMFKRVNKKSQ